MNRLVAGVACLLLLPVATQVPAILTMGLLGVIGVARLGWELWRRPQVSQVPAGQGEGANTPARGGHE